MKLKYYISNKILLLAVAAIIIAGSVIANADDTIYTRTGNEITKVGGFKLILLDNVTSDILSDTTNIYFFTEKNAYIINSSSGSIVHTKNIPGIREQQITDNYLWLKTSNVLYKINKATGQIESTRSFNRAIDAIYSFFGYGVSSSINEYNFIAGDNINISQSGNNITITGAATWSLSNLDVTQINVTYINGVHFNEWYLDVSDHLTNLQSFYNSLYSEQEEIKTNISNIQNNEYKYKQIAFEVSLNTTTLNSDLVLIPYDFLLNNITTQLNNNTGYLNYSVIKYSNYPYGNTTIIDSNHSAYLTIDTLTSNNTINRHGSIELQYHNYSNVTSAQILFELERI